MANCRGCGGVIGRDCWNELDCMSISQQEQSRAYAMAELAPYLLKRLSKLESILRDKGIDLSELDAPEPEVSSYNSDGLPF